MADIYVHNGGSNTSPYDTWAKAATTLTTGLSVATNADTVWIASDHTETAGAALTLTFPTSPGLRVISTDRTSGEPPATLAAGATINVGSVNAALALVNSAHIHGVTFNSGTVAGANADIQLHKTASNGASLHLESCVLNEQNANPGANIEIGNNSTATDDVHVILTNTEVRFGNTNQTVLILGARISASGMTIGGSTAPASLFTFSGAVAGQLTVQASDLTGQSFSTLVTGSANAHRADFVQCKVPSGITFLSSTGSTDGGTEMFVIDCANGDTHGLFAYYNPIGSAVSNTGTYFTAGAAGQSWAITTTSAANRAMPFRTPWINLYNTGTSAITPYLEVLRNNGTASAYTDAQVWAEIEAKVTSASTAASRSTDRASPVAAGTAQAAGAGTGSWTIASSSSPASFKCDSGASLTPAENGHIRARICVAVPSISGTLFVDPQIRT